jgi:leucyl-tRNA synthetase
VWDYCHGHIQDGSPGLAGATAADGAAQGETGEESGRDATEHLRQRLSKWSQRAVQRITEDMEGLEMHSAVRNVMRLFDRIRDFEKRVRARQGELSAPDRAALLDALSLLCQLLAPLAPHISEELRITLGNEASSAQTPWPGVSFQVPA